MAKLATNLRAVLQEIGEGSALLWLSLKMANAHGWRAFRSYSEDSCDIVLLRTHGTPRPGYRKELRIEVKARQNVKTNREGNQIHFTLTKAERDSCSFLIALWFDRGDFFIVPKKDLRPTKGNKTYQFVANVLKNGEYNDRSKKYLGKWERILNLLK
jgi:hypothetical protein